MVPGCLMLSVGYASGPGRQLSNLVVTPLLYQRYLLPELVADNRWLRWKIIPASFKARRGIGLRFTWMYLRSGVCTLFCLV